MNINIGKLNKKIKVYKNVIEKDSDGFESSTESLILSTWAQINNISGTTIIKSNADFEEVNTRFLIRTPKVVINNDMFIKFNDYIFEIKYVNDYEYDKQFTEIITKKVEI